MRVVAGIVAMLLLAGCVTTEDAGNGVAVGSVSNAEYQKYISRVGKSYWVAKEAYIVGCPGRNESYLCNNSIDLTIDSGEIKFEYLDIVKKKYSYYVTYAGGAAWVSADIVYDNQLLDKPRNEKRVGGPVKVGMTKQQVIDSDLGLPDGVKSWTGKAHVIEHWSYGGKDNQVIFFEDGRVTVIKKN